MIDVTEIFGPYRRCYSLILRTMDVFIALTFISGFKYCKNSLDFSPNNNDFGTTRCFILFFHLKVDYYYDKTDYSEVSLFYHFLDVTLINLQKSIPG